MCTKRVLVVENEPGLRTTYARDLTDRGFDVFSAGTIKEARLIIDELGETVDVALLDMRLEDDPDEPQTSGAELGLMLKKRCNAVVPEFLIRSAYAEIGYFKSAFELGAAVYLSKNDTGRDDVIRHVRALMLRHHLKMDNPNMMGDLNRIAAASKDTADSIKTFCEQVLAPKLSDCLGPSFILLLTDERGTRICATNADVPLGYSPAFDTLQAITHANADQSVPYVFEPRHLAGGTREEASLFETMEGAAFVSLASARDYRLSLGILKPNRGEKFPEEPHELAKVIVKYVRPVVCDSFILALTRLVEAQLETKRQTTLESMSQFCLFLGQDQLAMLNEGVAAGELSPESAIHQRLRMLAEDMEETGAILMNVSKSESDSHSVSIDMPELIDGVWSSLKMDWGLEDVSLQLEGRCSVKADEQDIYIVVARVLQWLAQRKAATEPPQEPTITVRCESDENCARLIFEDRSRRLPPRLRERLFEPFTLAVPSARSVIALHQGAEGGGDEGTKALRHRPGYLPLYLAKILVVEKYGGSLEDKTTEMEGEVGHRLLMELRKASEALTAGV
jgi:ActR/RegA family two-component response regulator